MNDLTFDPKGWSDYLYWQSLRPGFSRRIDEANRLVYDIDELQNIRILSCRGHYETM